MPSPMLPAVASTIVEPGFRSPRSSASRTIHTPVRSFTDPAGFMSSSLANSSTSGLTPISLILSMGVFPTSSPIES